MKDAPVISEPTAKFLESGLAITVACRDRELQPDGAFAWAARVHDDREHVTVFVHTDSARAMLKSLEAHPEIAVLFDQPTSHKACQIKGTFESSRPARDDERSLVERQVEGFARELADIGIPRTMTAGWAIWPCTAFEMRVSRLFEQTPGPGAGEPLK